MPPTAQINLPVTQTALQPHTTIDTFIKTVLLII
jgi:hypothetical protein